MKRPSILQVLAEGPELAPAEAPIAAPAEVRAKQQPRLVTQPADIVRTSIYISRASHERLREIAFAKRRRVHSLIVEAIDTLLDQHGLGETARVKLGSDNWRGKKK